MLTLKTVTIYLNCGLIYFLIIFFFKPTLHQSKLLTSFITKKAVVLSYAGRFMITSGFLEFTYQQRCELDLHLQERTSFRKHWNSLLLFFQFACTQRHTTYLNNGNIQMQIEWIAVPLFNIKCTIILCMKQRLLFVSSWNINLYQ